MDGVADADFAGLDDFPVDAAEVEVAGGWRLAEYDGILTEAGGEFLAAIVRQRRHFDDGFADAEAGADREILGGDVEVHDEVIAGSGQWLAVGDECGDVAANDGDLGIEFSGAALPFIAGDAIIDGKMDLLNGFVRARSATADDHNDAAGIFRGLGQGFKAGFQLGDRKVQRIGHHSVHDFEDSN